MLEQALRRYLLMKPEIAAMVGNRIHLGDFAPGKEKLLDKSQFPAVGIEADPQTRDDLIDGTVWSLQFPLFELVIKTVQFGDSIALGNLIAAAFRKIPFGATIFMAPGSVNVMDGVPAVIGVGTNWTSDMAGEAIQFRDGNGVLVYEGTIASVANSQAMTVTPAPDVTRQGLLWDCSSASLAVPIVQVDILGAWNEQEEDYGNGHTVKPRILKIRVGWNEPENVI